MTRLLMALSNRAHEEDVSFRTKMLELAATLPDVIALGRGDPDFHTPAHIVAAARAAIDANQHHYIGPAGLPALREAIAADLRSAHGLDYGADEIIVTADGPHGRKAALKSIDDEDGVPLKTLRAVNSRKREIFGFRAGRFNIAHTLCWRFQSEIGEQGAHILVTLGDVLKHLQEIAGNGNLLYRVSQFSVLDP